MTQYKEHRKFKNAKARAERILRNPDKLKNLITMALDKLNTMDKSKSSVGDFFRRVKVFIRMIKAYIRGDYRMIPWKMMVMLVAGLVYFVMPLDILPDFIPVTGFLDDITVIIWIFNNFKSEIDAFEAWERNTI
ncbi:YkvA family protein [Fulvivirgaceae bacterium BMA12]|uniref:YkvA family protein n=1 Tax=Agaribacillus aureus TaxID=3051825 RepID=A0ABT8LHB0_9BACT|nr:YkvA family protein [Fulvivirgaceae bacterium BMA12]